MVLRWGEEDCSLFSNLKTNDWVSSWSQLIARTVFDLAVFEVSLGQNSWLSSL